jgi:hypothetical protein
MTTQIKLASIESTALNTLQGPRITSVQVDVDSGYTSSTANAVGLSGGYISINGSGFVTGCSVIIGSLTATSVTFVSSIKVNCQIPAQSAGTYTIYLINPDGSTAIRVNSVQYSSTPTWSTSGTQSSVNPISLQLSASSDTTVSYALQAGSSLPSGMTLTSGGLLSGSVTGSGTTTYNFTIVATDVELQYTPQAFAVTISFTEPYFYLTTVAINADNNSTGTIISDASTNAFEMTVAGTPRASNFTPFGTGWSVYIPSGSYLLNTNTNTPLQLGTGAFCIEVWVNPDRLSGDQHVMTLGSGGIGFNINSSGGIAINRALVAVDYTAIGNSTLKIGIWTHIAIVRDGSSNMTVYMNGVSVYTASNSLNYTGGSFTIGIDANQSTTPIQAYLSNLRVVKGYQVYTGAFTPPTSPLAATQSSGTNIAAISTGTGLLICQSNRFIDNSTNAYPITATGSPTIQSFNPFNLSNTGSDGAMYFNGSTDHLSVPTATPLVLSGSVYTVECWCYLTSSDFSSYRLLVNKRIASTAASYNIFFNITNGYLAFYNGTQYNSSVVPVINAWNHVAAVYDGTNINLFMNGVRVLQTATTNPDNGGTVWIGVEADASTNRFIGYISNIRILKGTALYSGTTYTVPTSALTAITNTSLLILQNKYSHNTTQGHQDSSTNQLLITSAGSPAAGNFTPFSQSGWSNYFNGSSDFLTIASDAVYNLNGVDWTIECWFYAPTTPPATATNIIQSYQGTNSWHPYVGIGLNTNLTFFIAINAVPASTTQTFTLNTWNHVALVRNSGVVTFYLNGAATSRTITADIASTNLSWFIGKVDNAQGGGGYVYYFNGYISNVRIVKGTAVYTGTFTPPTTVLATTQSAGTNIAAISSGTNLLTCQSNRFIDNSTNAFAITASGTPSVQAFSPFAPTAAYSASTVGGSVYFSGTSDYLSATTSSQFAFGTNNFTVELWLYPTSVAASTTTKVIMSTYQDGSNGWTIGLNNTNNSLYGSAAGDTATITDGFGTITINQWYHIALVRNSTTLTLYKNGVSIGTPLTNSTNISSTAILSIGASTGGALFFPGYISNARIVKGTAVYTGTFTPPTTPLTSIANTTVLLNGTSTALTDVSSRYNLITTSLAKISTAVSKFGSGSMFFGTGNYVTVPSSVLAAWGTGDFTIETWIYLTSLAADTCIIDGRDGTGTAVKPCLFVQSSSSNFLFYVNGGIRIQGGTCSLSTWQHVAVCRSSGSTKMFVAGTQVGSTYTDANSYLACALRIGYFNDGSTTNSFNGYMDDLRITRYARYTTTFTPPTVTFIAR